MGAVPTTVEIFTADQWAQRILTLYPNNWSGDQAKAAGGILYSFFKTQGAQFNFQQVGLNFVLNACRIATATDVALDAIATDYFGAVGPFQASVVRQPGESDTALRQRIYANLLQGGGTRADIVRVVELLTGQAPRIIEPWNVVDTAACDSVSYCDIDTVANPSLVGDINLPYTAFLESVLPSFGGQGNNPVYCCDEGLACDRSFIIDPQPTWFLGQKQLDAAINRVRMFGTTIYRSYNSQINAGYARGNSIYPVIGRSNVPVNLYPPSSQPLVVLASTSWNSIVSAQATDNADFSLTFSTPAPGGQTADWIAAPATLPGFGRLIVPVGALNAPLATPIPGHLVLATPNWDTNIWLGAVEAGTVTFEFSSPAPPGAMLNYGSFASPNFGTVAITAGSFTPEQIPFIGVIPNGYQLILLPSWNTQFEVTKTPTSFTVSWSVPPPVGAFLCWGVFSQPY